MGRELLMLPQFLAAKIPEARKRRIAVSLILALLGAALYIHIFPPKTHSHLEGDFPAFYSAAQIVLSGQGERLYDYSLQASYQNEGEFLPFAYPPFFAAALSPLAHLGFWEAKLIWMLIMLSALFLTSRVLAKDTGEPVAWIFTLCLAFAPLYSSLVGGQNSALSLLILVSSVSLLKQDRFFLSGLTLGVLLFKPHFAGIIALFLLLKAGENRLQFCLGMLLPLVVFYLIGATVMGFAWPSVWLEGISRFSNHDRDINVFQMVSLASFFKNQILALLISGAVLLFLLFKNKIKEEQLGAATALLSPHTVYYDSALVLPAIIGRFAGSYFVIFLLLLSFLAILFKAQGGALILSLFLAYFSLEPTSQKPEPLLQAS